jgi:hypothetical protein
MLLFAYLYSTTSTTYTFLGQTDAGFITSNDDWLLQLGTVRLLQNLWARALDPTRRNQ